MADLTIERLAKVNIPLNVSNKPNNLSNYNRSTAVYNDSINLKEAIELIVGGGGGGAGTDLTLTRVGNVVTVLSSTGTDVVIPLAIRSLSSKKRLTYRADIKVSDDSIIDKSRESFEILGYRNRGGTLDTFGMLYANSMTWAHAVAKAGEILGGGLAELLSQEELAAVIGEGDPYILA